MKTCTRCKKDKPFEDYTKDKSKKDGLSSACKVCRNTTAKEYRSKPIYVNPKKAEIDLIIDDVLALMDSMQKKERLCKNGHAWEGNRAPANKNNPDGYTYCVPCQNNNRERRKRHRTNCP